jgi:hypothetical protein
VSSRFDIKGQVVAVTTREGQLWVWRGHGRRGVEAPWPRYTTTRGTPARCCADGSRQSNAPCAQMSSRAVVADAGP